MAKAKRWTEAEIAVLKEKFFASTIDELAALFPERTYNAVRVKAYTLHLCRKHRNPRLKPNRPLRPTKFIPLAVWEEQVLLAFGPRISFSELRLLFPRRSGKEIYELAEMFKITLFEEAL